MSSKLRGRGQQKRAHAKDAKGAKSAKNDEGGRAARERQRRVVLKIRVKEEKASRDYGTIDSLEGILTMVQLGALELAEGSFNRVTVDGDTSTNDSFVVIATHRAQHAPVTSLDSAAGKVLKDAMTEAWGEPPGSLYVDGDDIVLASLQFGNVVVMIQPPRGFGENPIAIYHDPDLPPSHHYLAAYHWLRSSFGAHAVVHVPRHGQPRREVGHRPGRQRAGGALVEEAVLPPVRHGRGVDRALRRPRRRVLQPGRAGRRQGQALARLRLRHHGPAGEAAGLRGA